MRRVSNKSYRLQVTGCRLKVKKEIPLKPVARNGCNIGPADGIVKQKAERMALASSVRAYRRFASSLSREERLLVVLRDEIYGGSWRRIRKDLTDRLKGRPYVLKLAGRIEEDLKRIKKIAEYEKTHEIDIAEFVPRKEAP